MFLRSKVAGRLILSIIKTVKVIFGQGAIAPDRHGRGWGYQNKRGEN